MPAASIQEGGCTTPPRWPVHRLPVRNVLPILALLSPAGVVFLLSVVAGASGPGLETIALLIRVGVVACGIMVGLWAVAAWLVNTREDRGLCAVGALGHAMLLVVGAIYVWVR
jgi:hypothetical protein